MFAKDIIKVIDELIAPDLAIENDNIGLFGEIPDDLEIENIKVIMDLLPEDDLKFNESDLIIAHHPPLFCPKTPTYVVHSNWDIIEGGANDALAEYLNIKPIETFDEETGIGRICSSYNKTLMEFLKVVCLKFGVDNVRLVDNEESNKILKKVAIVSGFGLSNKDFIKLAKEKNVDVYLSGDLNHKNAILAKKLNLTLIDVSHHIVEIPGLIALANLIEENEKIDVPVELIDNGVPWRNPADDFE